MSTEQLIRAQTQLLDPVSFMNVMEHEPTTENTPRHETVPLLVDTTSEFDPKFLFGKGGMKRALFLMIAGRAKFSKAAIESNLKLTTGRDVSSLEGNSGRNIMNSLDGGPHFQRSSGVEVPVLNEQSYYVNTIGTLYSVSNNNESTSGNTLAAGLVYSEFISKLVEFGIDPSIIVGRITPKTELPLGLSLTSYFAENSIDSITEADLTTALLNYGSLNRSDLNIWRKEVSLLGGFNELITINEPTRPIVSFENGLAIDLDLIIKYEEQIRSGEAILYRSQRNSETLNLLMHLDGFCNTGFSLKDLPKGFDLTKVRRILNKVNRGTCELVFEEHRVNKGTWQIHKKVIPIGTQSLYPKTGDVGQKVQDSKLKFEHLIDAYKQRDVNGHISVDTLVDIYINKLAEILPEEDVPDRVRLIEMVSQQTNANNWFNVESQASPLTYNTSPEQREIISKIAGFWKASIDRYAYLTTDSEGMIELKEEFDNIDEEGYLKEPTDLRKTLIKVLANLL